MFKKIKIDHFRGIAHLELSDLKKINLIVGENNCGKTSVLEALFLLINPGNSQLLGNVNILRGFPLISSEVLKISFLKSNIDKSVELEAELRDPSEKRTLRLTPSYGQNFIQNIQQEAPASGTGVTPFLGNKLKTADAVGEFTGIYFDAEIKQRQKKTRKTHSSIVLTQPNLPNSPLESRIDKDYKEIRKGSFVSSSDGSLVHRFQKIRVAKQTGDIVEVLKKIEPSLTGIETGANGLIYCDVGFENLLPINAMGGGFAKILSILTTIYDIKGGMVFIDEIENGLHHTAQESLWSAIIEAVKKFNVQIFATTHSSETVDSFGKAIKNHKEDEFRLFRIEKKEDEFDVVKYNSEDIKAIPDSDWEVR